MTWRYQADYDVLLLASCGPHYSISGAATFVWRRRVGTQGRGWSAAPAIAARRSN